MLVAQQRWRLAFDMATFNVRPKARLDIDGIWDHIAEDSEAQADAFVDRLIAKITRLAGEPGLGRLRRDLMACIAKFSF